MTEPRSLWSEDDLDRAWDRLSASDSDQVSDASFSDLIATARFLATHDDIKGPHSAFVRRLRSELHGPSTETVMHPMLSFPAVSPAAKSPKTRSRPALPRKTGGWRAAVEFATVALIIAALLGAGGVWLGFPPLHGGNSNHPSGNLAAATVGTPFPAPTATPPTGTMQGDVARTGQLPGPGPIGVPSIVWKVDAQPIGSPVIAGDRMYMLQLLDGPNKQAIVATDLATGATLWTTPVGSNIVLPAPSIANGLVYALDGSALIALDADTGKLVWTYQDQAKIRTNSQSPAVANGLVIATFRDSTVRAIDGLTGKLAWSAPIPASTIHPSFMSDGQLSNTQSPAVANGIVYTLGNGGMVLATDIVDGHEVWAFQADFDDLFGPVVSGGVVVVTGGQSADSTIPNAGVQAIDAATGVLKWKSPAQTWLPSIVATGGMLYLVGTSKDGSVIDAVDATSGETIWSYKGDGQLAGSVLSGGILYFSNQNGSSYGLDVNSQTLVWSVRLGVAGSPIVGNGLAFIASTGAIYALDGTTSEGTPTAQVGTPAALATPADLSGLPPCVPPRTVPAELPSGTPASTIDAETKVIGTVFPNTTAQILVGNLPTGDPASATDVAGMQQTIADISNCMPPAGESDFVAGFFTDDFYRRGPGAGGSGTYFTGWPSRSAALTIPIETTVVLANGRIAAQLNYNGKPRTLLIFVQQDGRWLIDEEYLIVTAYSGPKG